jgi:type II secretory pathway component PulF
MAWAVIMANTCLGKRLRTYQLARFYRTLGMLLKAGTPIIPALNSVAGCLIMPCLTA